MTQDEGEDKKTYINKKLIITAVAVAVVLAIGTALLFPISGEGSPAGEQTPSATDNQDQTNQVQENNSNQSILNTVKEGDVVVVNFKVKTEDETVLNSGEKQTLEVSDSGNLKPVIKEQLTGMKVNKTGEIENFTTIPEENRFTADEEKLKEELNITGELETGEEYQLDNTTVTIEEISNGTALVAAENKNPYAGETLSMEITVKEIKEEVEDEGNQTEEPEEDIEKRETPEVELFVMSYCPYGTQMQKAVLPVQEHFEGKANIDVKFVDYAMHDKKELVENTRQLCIQNENTGKYWEYLECFLNTSNSTKCMSKKGVDKVETENCMNQTYEEYGIMKDYNNKSTWKTYNGEPTFPIYTVQEELNEEYGVQGSPTFVLNGNKVNVNRTPEAIKNKICQGFKEEPPECQETLSTQTPSSGFGLGETSTGGGSCG